MSLKTLTAIFSLLFLAASASAQIKIKVPKVPSMSGGDKVQDSKTPQRPNVPVPAGSTSSSYDRQMVMDDAFTNFDAEHVNKYASNSLKDQDLGWYLKSDLRLMGTFPERSAFRVAVKKNGKQLSSVRCEGDVKTKAKDDKVRTNLMKERYRLLYDDYMATDLRCFKEDAANKEIGPMEVEVFFINGDTDAEKLVRTYKIDVHRATNVRGNALKPEQDVPSYYIQRHAEAGVAFAYFDYGISGAIYFKNAVERFAGNRDVRTLRIYSTYSPASGKSLPKGTFTRCSVNGQKLDLTSNYDRDNVQIIGSGRTDEIGSYTDRLTPQYQRGNPYMDKVIFRDLVFEMPFYTGGSGPDANYLKIEDHPGNWECTITVNGEPIRTFRWKVEGGKIVPHAEQQSGNVNLFYDAALIGMEIPAAGSAIDHRQMPAPNAGLFFGIPWSSADGKGMAARVPKAGSPYHKPSK
jgi:hypothetical protein